jgi:hypothetical protein
MLGRPSAKSTDVMIVSDEQPACYCPRALVRGAAYSSLSTQAYLLSDGTHGVTVCGRSGTPGIIAGR